MIYPDMIVKFTSLSLSDQSGNFTQTSDDTVSEVPKSLADKICSYFCVGLELGSPYLSLTFGFGGPNGPKIIVTINALVAPSTSYHFADGTEACHVLIYSSEDNQLTLGDSFLR